MAKRSFESMTEELEDILRKLADGGRPLDEMIKLYTRGMELTGKCRARLDEAENILAAAGEKENDGDQRVSE